MKKISNEAKVGITALITIIAFIWLYNFLKGKDLLTSTAHYYVVYDQIGGLAESSPVEVSGYRVGVVESIHFLKPGSGKLLVKLSIEKGIKVPVNSVAEITAASLIAGMKIQLVFAEGAGIYANGDTIPGRLAESLIAKVENELIPVKEKMTNVLSVLDSVISSINDIMDPQFRTNIKNGVEGLSNAANSIDEAAIRSSLENIDKFTRMLASNSEKFTNTFTNIEAVSDTLAAADLYTSVYNLKTSLEKATTFLNNLNNGKGTAGQFMTNDSLYRNLSGSLESLNLLLQDMKANPKRYVHFSIFGKKNIPAE